MDKIKNSLLRKRKKSYYIGQNDEQMIQKLFQQTIINDVLINEQQKWIKQWEIQLKQDEEDILATIRQ